MQLGISKSFRQRRDLEVSAAMSDNRGGDGLTTEQYDLFDLASDQKTPLAAAKTAAMLRQSTFGGALRWFAYGALVGLLSDIVIVVGTEDWRRWQTPRSLLATIVLVAIFGLVIRIIRDHQVRQPG
jgi:hypothetical protein